MAEIAENRCIVCLSEATETLPLQCCNQLIDRDCFTSWIGTCRQENKPLKCPHCRRRLTETGEVATVEEADVQEDTDFEGEDISFLLSEEIILEDTPPPSPPGDLSPDFRARLRDIWRERPLWRDDNEFMGQIRDALDGYLMTVSLGSHPSTVLENMNIYVYLFDRFQVYAGWEHFQT